MSSNTPLRIAIIGGGLAGAVLANALSKHAHLEVDIFESAPEFSERGAAVGIAVNGQTALAEIGGAVADVIERAGGVTMTLTRLVMMRVRSKCYGHGFELGTEQQGKVVHRAVLLAELLKPISEEAKHTNKKVVRIVEEEKGDVEIHFDDSTSFTADAVIGADGLRGFVRGHVLGKEHPALPARNAGFWDCRALLPIAQARELLGTEPFEQPRQYGYFGAGSFFMHDTLDNGETVQCVFSQLADSSWGDDEWTKPLDRAGLGKAVDPWDDTPLKHQVVEVMLQNPNLKAYAHQHHSIDAPTYTKGRVCIVGDAAHAMTPWQGSGAGQAIEDAMILETLLGEVKETCRIASAFQVYDQLRRDRTQKIVHSSSGTGVIMCGKGEGLGLDIAKVRDSLAGRWVHIYGLNLKKHKEEALSSLMELL